MIWIISLYAVGAVATLVYNLRLLVIVVSPATVLRNAILWPVFLPILLFGGR